MKKSLILFIPVLFAAFIVTGCASKPKTSSNTGVKKRVVYASKDGFSKNLFEIVTLPTAERDSAFAKASRMASRRYVIERKL